MNKIVLICLLAVGLSSCSINKQAQQIKALEQCEYKLVNASNITIAGTDVKKLIDEKSVNLVSIPAFALGYLRKDIPLRANLNLEISNPSGALAAINNFEYIILINRQEIANGSVDQRVSIDAGQKITVPVQLNANIYQFIANGKVLDDITAFLTSASKGTEKKGMVTLKIKPSILVGNNLVKYPGYITIDKEVSSKILL
ncbi:hypothetical protein [Pedobacter boryungensis]|uniref:Late embryogenesis abundant protein n=1 Tax=Pedobacter boryungensis TaxID=869962 RepID=A0ABX2DF51_9SPHI|nr:hypothetical protein [Pedobacter boryungensis]NQX31774.1 hypothetical protein [Pedobacter boryungensis]